MRACWTALLMYKKSLLCHLLWFYSFCPRMMDVLRLSHNPKTGPDWGHVTMHVISTISKGYGPWLRYTSQHHHRFVVGGFWLVASCGSSSKGWFQATTTLLGGMPQLLKHGPMVQSRSLVGAWCIKWRQCIPLTCPNIRGMENCVVGWWACTTMTNNLKPTSGEGKLVPQLWHNLHWLKASKPSQTMTWQHL